MLLGIFIFFLHGRTKIKKLSKNKKRLARFATFRLHNYKNLWHNYTYC